MTNTGEASGTLVVELSPEFRLQGSTIHESLQALVEGFRGLIELNRGKCRDLEEMEAQWASVHFCASLHIYSVFLALSASLFISRDHHHLIGSVSQCLNSRHLRQRIGWADFGQVLIPSPMRWT